MSSVPEEPNSVTPLPEKVENATTIHHKCAKWCVYSLLTGFGLGVVTQPIGAHAQTAVTKIVTGGIPSLFFLAAFICGFLALAGIPRNGTKGLLVRGLCGVLIPVVLFASAVFAFNKVRAVSIAAKARAAVASINKGAPKPIDEITTLQGAVFSESDRKLTLTIRVDSAPDQIDRKAWSEVLEPNLRTSFESDGLARLRDLGVIVVYRYVSNENKVIDEIEFTLSNRLVR
jgi:hypothetical protein